jgi:hypothetical protein
LIWRRIEQLPEWLNRSSGQAGPEMADGHKLAVLPVSREAARRYACREPVKGKLMSEMSDWFQNNWIDLAGLFVQGAILVAVVRYGRKLLATLRASQEQVGALLKLSVSDTVEERPTPAPEPARQFEPPPARVAQHEPEREPEPEPAFAGAFARTSYAGTSYADEREHTLGGRVIGSQAPAFATPAQRAESPSLTPWVSAPTSAPEPLHTQATSIPAPSMSTWVQPPVRRNGASPWRKMVRWLQAPVRS